MALVVITICDDEENGIDISAKAEPFIPGPDSDVPMTPAQTAGIIAISSIAAAMQADEAEVPEASADR